MSSNTEKLSPVMAEFAVELSARLTPVLKDLAVKAGWPENVIKSLSLTVDENYTVCVVHPGIPDEVIDALEYGDHGPINSVIRVFMNRYKNAASDFLSQDFANKMFDVLEVSF